MIVIPMLGRSSRFSNAGYALPKYQLPLGGKTVFAHSVRSFEKQFKNTPFLFLVRNDHNARAFVSDAATQLGITDFRIIEFQQETRGQAESVLLGVRDYVGSQPIVIFNIDTIRHNFHLPSAAEFGDGFLEVFKADGDGWSFVAPGEAGRVIRTTEKERISDLCSNGMYGFARIQDFRDAYAAYTEAGNAVRGEVYIAPLYNVLIAKGRDIRYHLLDADVTEHCGVPADYERLRAKFGS